MPSIQPADLWKESGRYDDYGKEMLRIKDRHERDLLYGPTHEEVITDIARHYIHSYRQLPQILYQIGWKFRDEIRPRFGVMRGREFLMKDAYSFDLSYDQARKSYERMFDCYLRTFRRMGLQAVPVRADSGAIGGDLSHEFHIVADTGESTLYYDPSFDQLSEINFAQVQGLYAATDEKHDPMTCPLPQDQLGIRRGIEVGHIFYFGTKYSRMMNLRVSGSEGDYIVPEMGSYGIGVSRLVGAVIEANHDDKGIIWPQPLAPFSVGIITMKEDKQVLAQSLYQQLLQANLEPLWDDRDERAGVKFADMDLIGIPWHIVLGNKSSSEESLEIKNRRTGEAQTMSISRFIDQVRG
jgi:prolyl-tRNA synthetase